MKRLLVLICAVVTLTTIAQNNDSTKKLISGYASIGLSITNTYNFKMSSYTTAESGINYKNIGVGLIIGRGSLDGIASETDNIVNYFYELKTTSSFPIGMVNGSVLFGYGSFFNSSNKFIEYGFGVSYSINKMGYGITYSNWNSVNYITPSITFNFN